MIQQKYVADVEEPFRILIVDDEPHIINFLKLGLKYEGFTVAVAEDGPSAMAEVGRFKPHLVILDLMLPGIDGLEVAARLRQDPEILIIMLTARDQVADRVTGLGAGGDDYIVKPFDFEELVARIRATARRRLAAQSEVLRAGPIVLDDQRRVVTVDGVRIDLTMREYDLLRLFMLHPQHVLSRQLILDRVWGFDFFGDENNVEVYVGYLRRKLGDARHMIETVRGIGYRLNA